jgi:hypothetical protein
LEEEKQVQRQKHRRMEQAQKRCRPACAKAKLQVVFSPIGRKKMPKNVVNEKKHGKK